ncbi:MAG: MerR family transcriptional regulator [bacterium]
MKKIFHSIQVASARSGVSANLIRAWEKRYGAIEPKRTKAQHRLYSDDDIKRLTILCEVTRSGYRIGNVAAMQTKELQRLAKSLKNEVADSGERINLVPRTSAGLRPEIRAKQLRKLCIGAMKEFDRPNLEALFKEASTLFGWRGLLQLVIAPFAQETGELWRNGTITAAHEHFASSVIATFLSSLSKAFTGDSRAPLLIVATPSGQLHELGALLVAASAANLGWRVLYLGVSLPAAEIAGAAIASHARAVALSLVYPEDDPNLPAELMSLKDLMPEDIALIVGGRAMNSYAPVLNQITELQAENLNDFDMILDDLHKSPKNKIENGKHSK